MQILTNDFDRHSEVKAELLELIDSFKKEHDTRMPSKYVEHGEDHPLDSVHSDWHITEVPRPYLVKFFKEIEHLILNVGNKIHMGMFGEFEWNIHYAWFQQYYDGGNHWWHTHQECQFTNIYFLELPDESYKTEIMGLDGKKIEYEAKEGQMITLPSFLLHRSKPNQSGRKTILSFNTSYGIL